MPPRSPPFRENNVLFLTWSLPYGVTGGLSEAVTYFVLIGAPPVFFSSDPPQMGQRSKLIFTKGHCATSILQNLSTGSFALKLSSNNNGYTGSRGSNKKRKRFSLILFIKKCISILYTARSYIILQTSFLPMLSDCYKLNRVPSFRVSPCCLQYQPPYQEIAISRLLKVSYSVSRLYRTWLSLFSLLLFLLFIIYALSLSFIIRSCYRFNCQENRSRFFT